METESYNLLRPLVENRMNDIRLKYRKKHTHTPIWYAEQLLSSHHTTQQITAKQINKN